MNQVVKCTLELQRSWMYERYQSIKREKKRGATIKELVVRFGVDAVDAALNTKTGMFC
jgi:hypothetical protein